MKFLFCAYNVFFIKVWRRIPFFALMTLLYQTKHGNMTLFITLGTFWGFAVRGGFSITNITKVLTIFVGFVTKTDIIVGSLLVSQQKIQIAYFFGELDKCLLNMQISFFKVSHWFHLTCLSSSLKVKELWIDHFVFL